MTGQKTQILLKPKGWLIYIADEELRVRVEKILTLKNDSYRSPWKHIKMYGLKGFKTGLIDFINARVTDIELISDITTLQLLDDKDIKLLKLRDYQIEAANNILTHARGIITSPTASGKTMIELALSLKFPKPLIFLVPSTGLLSAAYREMKEKGITKKYKVTIYGGGTYKDTTGDIVLMTNASLTKQSKPVKAFMKICKAIISDEVHHSTGKLYSILGRCPALYRAGFSATPWAEDWSDAKVARLISNFGHEVYDGYADTRVTPFRMKPTVYIAKYKNKDTSIGDELMQAIQSHNYIEQKRYEIVQNTGRNRFIVQLAEILRHRGLHTFIIVHWKEHVYNIEAVAKELDIPITFLTGDDDAGYRDDIYLNLKKPGQEPIIICGTVGSEGIDLVHLSAVILAAGEKSEIRVVQSCGRAARQHPDKKIAIMIDIQDSLFPKHIKARNNIYKRENYEVLPIKTLLELSEDKK
jgi:superfamily II DNA or RNA helicase